jgi:uncharacterized membrane protein YbhN (UPF0104 family)
MITVDAVKRSARSVFGWNTLGVALSIAILVAASFALFHLLRDIDVSRVGDALRAMPIGAIVIAAILVAASYVTLTFYDYFALRTTGQSHVPYRIAALTGFLAYTIGHSVGATVITGNAVRLRIYSGWGLGVIDVAKIAFVTGLTFWLGNAVTLGLGVAYDPGAAVAINRLPAWVNQGIALAVLGVIAAYLLWLLPRPRAIGRNGWQVVLPNARLTLLQIGIGMLDLGLAALAMFVLVSAHSPVELSGFIVAFVIASLLGFASHTPGSLGVFDAAMIVALPQIEKELLLASLLVFRGLYFVLPFCIAVLALGCRELWRLPGPRPLSSN